MNRYCFYIDGFNVYFALKEYYKKYKWLDYGKLARSIIGSKDLLVHVYYFSSFVTWKPKSVANHKEYIKALRSSGVEFIKGRFKDKTLTCHKCLETYKSHEEKQTDVNIAVQVVADAAANKYDKAIIVTADTDLIPAIKAVHNLTPEKEIGILLPIGRNSFELRQAADFTIKMKTKNLKACQFADELKIGSDIIKRPDNWK